MHLKRSRSLKSRSSLKGRRSLKKGGSRSLKKVGDSLTLKRVGGSRSMKKVGGSRSTRRRGGSPTLKKVGGNRVGKQRGGIAPVTAPTTILTPLEQSRIFLYPLADNFRNDLVYTDSRIPFLNVSI